MSEVLEIKEEPNDFFSPDTDSGPSRSDEYEIISDSTVNNSENNLCKPSTVERFNNLKTTEYLHNNLFRLQVKELLSETPIRNKRRVLIQKWKTFFQAFVETLPDYTILLSCITAAKNSRIRVDTLTRSLSENITDLKTDDDFMLQFGKPLWYEMFGLYENECQPGSEVTLNVHLIMPERCFHMYDYFNNRYTIKKYYYLLYIKEYIKQCNMITSIKLTYHDNNVLLPILKFHLENDKKVTINIFVSSEKRTFDPSRFLPDKNNVSENIFSLNVPIDVFKLTPTAYYNSSLGFDGTLAVNICNLSETLHGLNNLHEAIKLLCIWLKQRELNLIGFTEDLVVYFVVYLYEKKTITNYMSSYEIIKNFWTFISISDLQNEPIGFATEECFMEIFKEYYDVIFIDKTGYYNLTSFLIKEVYDKVKSESASALKILNDNVHNSFRQLFLNRSPFYLQYDLIIKISELTWKRRIPPRDKVLFSGYYYFLMVRNLLDFLKCALDKRYLHIIPKIETEDNKITNVSVGINLNPDEAFNNFTLGPVARLDSTAMTFELFWNPRVCQIPLGDGSIHLAVHFLTDTVRSKRQIITNILKFMFEEKLELKYEIFYDEFEDHLLNKMLVPPYPCGTNEETTSEIIKTWDELGNLLTDLNVFFNITGIQAMSDIFYYANPVPPIPQNFEKIDCSLFLTGEADEAPPHIQSIYSVFQSDLAFKWSDSFEEICDRKTTFYLRMVDLIEAKHNIKARASHEYIEIPFHGLVFRYILFFQKEIDLAKQLCYETLLTSTTDTSVDSLEIEKRYVFLPKIIEGLKGVQAQYPSFGPGTALIKRWLRAQLIDDFYFPDIAVDLINASLYLNSPSNNVNTPQASFLRFLNFFSDFDDHHQVVVVNFNDILTENEINKQESELVKRRYSYANLFILTPFDARLSMFTRENPSKGILARIKELCLLSLNFVEDAISGKSDFDMQEVNCELFIPKYNGYNVLIHLKNSSNSRRYEKIVPLEEDDRVVIEELEDDVNSVLPPVVDFNPVDKYLKTLRKNYGKYAFFFHDSYGGNVIGVLWHSKVLQAADINVPKIKRMKLCGGKLDFDKDAAIENFNVLGEELVDSIDELT